MKPDWNDAPVWANYIAMDADGDWYWYEKKPYPHQTEGWWCWEMGNCRFAMTTELKWNASLEERP